MPYIYRRRTEHMDDLPLREDRIPAPMVMESIHISREAFWSHNLATAFKTIFEPHMGDWPLITGLTTSEEVVKFMNYRTTILDKMLEVRD